MLERLRLSEPLCRLQESLGSCLSERTGLWEIKALATCHTFCNLEDASALGSHRKGILKNQ